MTARAGAPGTAAALFRAPHVTDDDVTEARRPTPAEQRAIRLLELNPHGARLVRLSLAWWRRVDNVADALVQAGAER